MIFTDEVLRRAGAVIEREPALRDTMAPREVLAEIQRGRSSAEYFARACERYAERTCLTSVLGSITYGRLWERATRIASALSPGEHVGICGTPGIDWVVVDLACLIAGAVSVPLAVNLAPAELRSLIEHADLTRIVCGASRVAAVAQVSSRPLFAMRNDLDDAGATANVAMLAELEAGAARDPLRGTDADLVTIMYSSGTTGRPKGVMLGERRWRAHLENALGWPPFPHVWIGYLPHAQIAGRRLVLEVMMHGGVTHFAFGALPLDDLRRVRPTIIPLLPRVSAIVHQQYQRALAAGREPEEAMAALRAEYATDRLCTIRVGSGSTPPDVLAFLARCFDVPVADGYGTTETGALAINGVLFDHVEYKLVEVPELGYTLPCGELLVRSAENTPGYYKDPDATAALFDAGGFLRTGDIVAETAPRRIVWLDRRTNVTKLAQGHFVATSELEALYASRSTVIDQIFVYANPRHASLLAVIVPSGAASGTDDALRSAIREDLDRIARDAGRPPHEVPRDFVIERAPFSVANGLLTESGKQNLRRLREHYANALDAMHAAIEARQLSHAALADPDLDLASRVRAAAAVTLGLTVDAIVNAPEVGFVGFGGDSLGALRFCQLLEDALGVKVPVAIVLDRSTGLAAIVDVIANRMTIAFEDVHPHPVASAAELAQIVPVDPPIHDLARTPPRTVLLTGATGFVGRMLALALAERVRVICLVRGETDRIAAARFRAAVDGTGLDAELDSYLASGGIEVVAGDLMRPELGIASHDLAGRIDAIVHAGALVNHALPYRHLFAPNVLGTREVARLALLRPGVPFCFLSSIGVPIQQAREVDSPEPGAGYATSKWACEVMLEELHRRFDMPVAIVRCGNVAPPRDHPAALNWADNTNRLIHSLIATRLAPQSFYTGPGGRYDLVPLDAVVAAVTTIATAGVRGLATYHVTSDDEVSLDTLVAWIESAGIPLVRLPHAAWFIAWRDRLQALPADIRARSAFATLDRWREPVPADRIARFDTASYRAIRSSVVDEALVHRWVAALTTFFGG